MIDMSTIFDRVNEKIDAKIIAKAEKAAGDIVTIKATNDAMMTRFLNKGFSIIAVVPAMWQGSNLNTTYMMSITREDLPS